MDPRTLYKVARMVEISSFDSPKKGERTTFFQESELLF